MKLIKIILLALISQMIFAQGADTLNYTKTQTNRAIRIALDSVYQKLQMDAFLAAKANLADIEDSVLTEMIKSTQVVINQGRIVFLDPGYDSLFVTIIGGVWGYAGLRVGETVQVTEQSPGEGSPTVGFIKDGNISDLHPPNPMTGTWDWHLPDASGFLATSEDIQDSLAQRDSLIEYLRHDAMYFSIQDTAAIWAQNKILIRMPWNITIDSVAAVITNGTYVDMNFSHTSNIAVEGNQVFSDEWRVTSQTAGDVNSTFNSSSINRNRWLFLSISAVDGAVTQLSFTIYFRKD